MVKRSILMVMLLPTVLLCAAWPALAQTSGEGGALARDLTAPPSPPPKYAVEGDLLITEGDEVVDCNSLAYFVEQGGTDAMVQRDLALCYQYGFSPSGVQYDPTPPRDAPATGPLLVPPGASPATQPPPGRAMLPATGGPDLLLSAVAGVLISMGLVGILLEFTARRRWS